METPGVFQNSEVFSGQTRQGLQCHLDSWASENEAVGFAFRESPLAALWREPGAGGGLQGPGSLHREVGMEEMAGQTARDGWARGPQPSSVGCLMCPVCVSSLVEAPG